MGDALGLFSKGSSGPANPDPLGLARGNSAPAANADPLGLYGGPGATTPTNTDPLGLFSGSGTTAPKKSGGGGGGLLGTIAHGIGKAASVAADVGTGIAGTVRDLGKAAYVIPDELLVKGASGDQLRADYEKRIPYVAQMGKGMAQTMEEVAHPTQIAKNYSANPFGAALNDLGNVALVAGPAAGALGAVGKGAEAGSAAAKIGQASDVLKSVAEPLNLPIKAGRSVLTRAAEGAMAENAASPGLLARLGTKLTPAYQDLSGTILEGKAQERAVQAAIRSAPDDAVTALRQAGYEKAAATLEAASAKAARVGTTINPEQVAVGAIRADTAAKLVTSPVVETGEKNGLVSLKAATQGVLPPGTSAEGAYIPRPLANAIKPLFTAATDVAPRTSGALSALDPLNHLYYQAKLNLSPATVVGRLGGHPALVGVGANHPLDSLLQAARAFTGKLSPEELASMPARVSKASTATGAGATQLAEDLAGKTGVVARTTGALDRLANKSPVMKFASKMDDALRKGVYLAETKAGAGAEEAIRAVNRVTGEFDNLSPLEQSVARRIAPMYNWHKQIAKIAGHLAEDHPGRAAFAAHLGDISQQLGNQPGGTPGELQFGGHAISPGFLVPFGEAGTSLKNLGLGNLGPVPKAIYGQATGQNPNTGKPFSGPVQGVDYRVPGVLENLRKALPQVNLVDALTGHSDVVRYTSGDPVLIKGKPIPTNSNWLDALLSFGGLRSENAKAAADRQAAVTAAQSKKAVVQNKQLAKYETARQKAGL